MRKRHDFSKARNAHKPKHEPAKPKPESQWYEVASFSGGGSQKTESFEIFKDRFRINWHVSGQPGLRFVAQLRHHGEIIPEHDLINSNKRTAGEKIISEYGDLYLVIGASDADWSIKVEQEEA